MVNLRFWNFKPISRNVRFICCDIFSEIMMVCFHLKQVLLSFSFMADISRFYNVLSHRHGSTSFYFNRNIMEGSIKFSCKLLCFLTYGLFSENIHFWGCNIFYRQVLIQSTQFYECLFASNKIHVLIKHIFVLATDAMVTEKLSFSYFHGNQCYRNKFLYQNYPQSKIRTIPQSKLSLKSGTK